MELDAEDLELLGYGAETLLYEMAVAASERHEVVKEQRRDRWNDIAFRLKERERDKRHWKRTSRNPAYWARKNKRDVARIKKKTKEDPAWAEKRRSSNRRAQATYRAKRKAEREQRKKQVR